MSFAHALAKDITEAIEFEAWRTGTPALVDNDSSQMRTLALLRSELILVGTTIGIVASIANAQSSLVLPAQCALNTFEPAFSVAFSHAIESHSDNPAYFILLQHWQTMSARLKMAHDVTECFTSAVQQDGATDFVEIGNVADAWQRTCRTTLALHGCIASTMAEHDCVADPRHEGSALELLRGAADGRSPCIDAKGRLSIPGWAERRSAARRALQQPIRIRFGAAAFPAMLQDVSQSGFGLDVPIVIARGSDVTITTAGGREFSGTVKWCKGKRIGLELHRHLDSDDPLLIGDAGA